MNPLLLLIPALGIGGTAVVLHERAKAKQAPGQALPIPGGTGTVVVPTSIGPGQTVPNVSITQLPPAVQAALNTPGAPPNQAFLNGVAQALATGQPGAANVLKARNGLIFDPTARTLIPGLKAGDIAAGLSVTFSPSDAGMQISSIPGGSSIMLAQSDSTADSVSGIFIDPRIPENTAVTIPLSSVTGLGSP